MQGGRQARPRRHRAADQAARTADKGLAPTHDSHDLTGGTPEALSAPIETAWSAEVNGGTRPARSFPGARARFQPPEAETVAWRQLMRRLSSVRIRKRSPFPPEDKNPGFAVSDETPVFALPFFHENSSFG
jgi:hypothetical protein